MISKASHIVDHYYIIKKYIYLYISWSAQHDNKPKEVRATRVSSSEWTSTSYALLRCSRWRSEIRYLFLFSHAASHRISDFGLNSADRFKRSNFHQWFRILYSRWNVVADNARIWSQLKLTWIQPIFSTNVICIFAFAFRFLESFLHSECGPVCLSRLCGWEDARPFISCEYAHTIVNWNSHTIAPGKLICFQRCGF